MKPDEKYMSEVKLKNNFRFIPPSFNRSLYMDADENSDINEENESLEECCMREVQEETGLDVSKSEGGYLFSYKRENPSEGDNYFVDIYRFIMDFDEADLNLQESETLGYKLATPEEIKSLVTYVAFKESKIAANVPSSTPSP